MRCSADTAIESLPGIACSPETPEADFPDEYDALVCSRRVYRYLLYSSQPERAYVCLLSADLLIEIEFLHMV